MRPRTLRPNLRRGLLGVTAVACLALTGAASASAKVNKEEFKKFINCPIETAKACNYGETLAGEFKMGSKTVTITNPEYLQGGLAYTGFGTLPLIPPRFGAEELSKSPQPIPGGLTGVSELIGGPASATTELAGTPEVTVVNLGFGRGIAVTLPVKIHLENETLGDNCYIGSESEPIVLNLTDGTTTPPEGTEPISGEIGTIEDHSGTKIIEFKGNKLVDNTFAVPGVHGCGTSSLEEPIIDTVVDAAAGLPSAAGKNVAVLEGNFYNTEAQWVAKYDKIKKEKKK